MRTRMSLARFFCYLFLAAIIEMAFVHAKPEPMARPTRPKIITSPEELKRYADLIRDYYHLVGKARYGKRDDVAPMTDCNTTWEMQRMIQEAQRGQNEQRRRNKEQFLLNNFQNSDVDKHMSRVATRPGSLTDIIGKYYDDVQ